MAALTNFSYVVDGVLAGSAFPSGTPEEVVAELKSKGIKCVVNLTEGAHPAAAELEAAQIRAVHMPLADFAGSVTDDMKAFAALALDERNYPLLVHCRAGVGRTGMMLGVGVAALRHRSGAKVETDAVVAEVRATRPQSLQVPAQLAAVAEYVASLQ